MTVKTKLIDSAMQSQSYLHLHVSCPSLIDTSYFTFSTVSRNQDCVNHSEIVMSEENSSYTLEIFSNWSDHVCVSSDYSNNPRILSIWKDRDWDTFSQNVFTIQMLKCPETFHFDLSISKEDINFGMASTYWLTSFGNKKDTPVNLGDLKPTCIYNSNAQMPRFSLL